MPVHGRRLAKQACCGDYALEERHRAIKGGVAALEDIVECFEDLNTPFAVGTFGGAAEFADSQVRV